MTAPQAIKNDGNLILTTSTSATIPSPASSLVRPELQFGDGKSAIIIENNSPVTSLVDSIPEGGASPTTAATDAPAYQPGKNTIRSSNLQTDQSENTGIAEPEIAGKAVVKETILTSKKVSQTPDILLSKLESPLTVKPSGVGMRNGVQSQNFDNNNVTATPVGQGYVKGKVVIEQDLNVHAGGEGEFLAAPTASIHQSESDSPRSQISNEEVPLPEFTPKTSSSRPSSSSPASVSITPTTQPVIAGKTADSAPEGIFGAPTVTTDIAFPAAPLATEPANDVNYALRNSVVPTAENASSIVMPAVDQGQVAVPSEKTNSVLLDSQTITINKQPGPGQNFLDGHMPSARIASSIKLDRTPASQNVESVPPGGAEPRAAISDLPTVDTPMTITPPLVTNTKQGNVLNVFGFRQAPVRSGGSGLKVPQPETSENPVIASKPSSVSASPSPKPTIQLTQVETTIALPQNENKVLRGSSEVLAVFSLSGVETGGAVD